jgi:transposase
MNTTKQRSFHTIPNKNICVPIGSILAVQVFYEKLNFCDIFSKHKSKGLDLNSLLIGLLRYKLIDNFSIKEAGKWLNQEEILNILNLERFHERVLYRTLEILGRNREEILSDILESLFSVYDFEETNLNLD